MKHLSAAMLCSLLLAGCATSVVSTNEATPGTLLPGGMARQSPGSVPIVFKRDSGFMGGGCSYRVFVNGVPAADVGSGQAVTIYVGAASHIVGARPNGICGGGDSELEIDLRDGRSRTYRISSDQGGSVRIQPTAF